ncbi:hypothetical protein DFH09DRAFT_1325361 [Mycena vulgaris]|nr:hypothetical protein DFH09DRAFT_1325361 [Mycena vulgaris]
MRARGGCVPALTRRAPLRPPRGNPAPQNLETPHYVADALDALKIPTADFEVPPTTARRCSSSPDTIYRRPATDPPIPAASITARHGTQYPHPTTRGPPTRHIAAPRAPPPQLRKSSMRGPCTSTRNFPGILYHRLHRNIRAAVAFEDDSMEDALCGILSASGKYLYSGVSTYRRVRRRTVKLKVHGCIEYMRAEDVGRGAAQKEPPLGIEKRVEHYVRATYVAQVAHCKTAVHTAKCADRFAADLTAYGTEIIQSAQSDGDVHIWDACILRLRTAFAAELTDLSFDFAAKLRNEALDKETKANAVATARATAETSKAARPIEELLKDGMRPLDKCASHAFVSSETYFPIPAPSNRSRGHREEAPVRSADVDRLFLQEQPQAEQGERAEGEDPEVEVQPNKARNEGPNAKRAEKRAAADGKHKSKPAQKGKKDKVKETQDSDSE